MIHRDLKAENVLLLKQGLVIKLLDFGIAKGIESNFESKQTFIGTTSYMAPETLRQILIN